MYRFDVISLSIICLGAIMCDITNIGFVSVYACRVCGALVARLCNHSLGVSNVPEPRWTSLVKGRMTQLILALLLL